MVSFRFPKGNATANALVGLLLLQLGTRGVAIFLNERGGNTYDVAGDFNGRRYWWMLLPESWTLDVVTRFSFWLLLPIGLFFLVRSALLFRTTRGSVAAARRLSIIVLAIVALWMFLIATWGVVITTASSSPSWSPPELLFPTALYVVITRTWPLFLGVSILCIFIVWRLSKRSSNKSNATSGATH